MMRTVINICSEDDLNGVCGQQTIEFVLPIP
jgi:hypothetical protein